MSEGDGKHGVRTKCEKEAAPWKHFRRRGLVHRGVAIRISDGELLFPINSLQDVPVRIEALDSEGIPTRYPLFTGDVVRLACEADMLLRAARGMPCDYIALYHAADAPETEEPIDCMACIAAGGSSFE